MRLGMLVILVAAACSCCAASASKPATPTIAEVPAGSADVHEDPQHPVHVAAFSIDAAPATVGAYRRCVATGACDARGVTGQGTICAKMAAAGPYAQRPFVCSAMAQQPVSECNYGWSGRESLPMNCVDWGQAHAFCKWQGARMVEHAEWQRLLDTHQAPPESLHFWLRTINDQSYCRGRLCMDGSLVARAPRPHTRQSAYVLPSSERSASIGIRCTR